MDWLTPKARLEAATVGLSVLALAAALSATGGALGDGRALIVFLAAGAALLAVTAYAPVKLGVAHHLFLLFLATLILTALFSTAPTHSLAAILPLFSYFLVFLTAGALADTDGSRRLAAISLTAVGAVVAAEALGRYFLGFDRQISELAVRGEGVLSSQLASMANRAFGNFANANSLAGFLALMLPIALGLLLVEKRVEARAGAGAAAALIAITLYFTYSKGAWISLSAGLIVALCAAVRQGFFRPPWRRRAAAGGIGLVLVAAATWVLRGSAAFSLSAEGRLELWRGAWRMLARYPWTGVGYEGFGINLTAIQKGAAYSRYAHNSYLQLAAETGIIGFGLLITLLGALFVFAWKRGRESEVAGDTDWLQLGFLASIVAFILHNAVDFTWYVPGVAVAFWLVAGLASASGKKVEPVGRLFSPRPAGVAVLSVAVMVLGAVSYANAYFAVRAGEAFGAGRFSDAVALYGSARRILPYGDRDLDGLARAHFYLARQSRKTSSAAAIKYGRQAVKANPGWPFYHARLADYLAGAGRKKEALVEYHRAVALYPNDPGLKRQAADYLRKLGEYRAAIELYRQSIELITVYAPQGTAKEQFLRARGDISEPLKNISGAYAGLARVYLEQGRYDQAAAILKKAEREIGLTQDGSAAFGEILEARGRYREAGRYYEQAIRGGPYFERETALRLINVLAKAGDRDAALAAAERLVGAAPDYKPGRALLETLRGKEQTTLK